MKTKSIIIIFSCILILLIVLLNLKRLSFFGDKTLNIQNSFDTPKQFIVFASSDDALRGDGQYTQVVQPNSSIDVQYPDTLAVADTWGTQQELYVTTPIDNYPDQYVYRPTAGFSLSTDEFIPAWFS